MKEDFKNRGVFRIGKRNERGDRFIEFAEKHKLIIANTPFQKLKNSYWTGNHPVGKQETKQILY